MERVALLTGIVSQCCSSASFALLKTALTAFVSRLGRDAQSRVVHDRSLEACCSCRKSMLRILQIIL